MADVLMAEVFFFCFFCTNWNSRIICHFLPLNHQHHPPHHHHHQHTLHYLSSGLFFSQWSHLFVQSSVICTQSFKYIFKYCVPALCTFTYAYIHTYISTYFLETVLPKKLEMSKTWLLLLTEEHLWSWEWWLLSVRSTGEVAWHCY